MYCQKQIIAKLISLYQ